MLFQDPLLMINSAWTGGALRRVQAGQLHQWPAAEGAKWVPFSLLVTQMIWWGGGCVEIGLLTQALHCPCLLSSFAFD